MAVTGSPCEWNATVLIEELTHAGLQNVKVLSRKSWGKQVEWWVEATAEKDSDFLGISVGSRFVVVVAAPVTKPKRQTVKKLASGGRVLFTDPRKTEEDKPGVVKAAGKSFYIGTPLKQKEVQPTQVDATLETPDEKMDEETRNNSEKRLGGTPVKDRPSKRPAVMSKPPHGLKARANLGAGNCVFEALGQGLSPEQPKPARSVRASIVNHLQRHAARYQPWWDGKEPSSEEKPCESWDLYLSKLAKVGAWGGSIELAAAAVHYDRPIIVFQPTGVPEIYNAQGKAGSAILLWFCNRHYEFLEGALPDGVAQQAATGPMQGGRGGGDGGESVALTAMTRASALPSDAGSGRTCNAAMPAIPSQSRRRPLLQPLPSSSSSKRRGKTSVATASQGRGEAEDSSVQAICGQQDAIEEGKSQTAGGSVAESSSQFKQKPRDWQCPKCDFKTGWCRLWAQKKSAHIKAWHPDDRQELLAPVPSSFQLQKAEPGMKMFWKCPHCDLGIPEGSQTSGDQRYYMKKRHHDECHPKTDFRAFKMSRAQMAANAAKATQKVRAAGVARRLLGIKQGEAGPHDPVIVTLPGTGKAKKQRNLTRVICKKCTSMTASAKQLAKLPCERCNQSRGPKRKKMLVRLRKALASTKIGDQLKKGCQQVLSIIEGEGASSSSPKSSGHLLEAIVWPVDGTVQFVCTRCRRLSLREQNFRSMPCANQTVWNNKRLGMQKALSDIAAGKPCAMQRAAVRAIQLLAMEEGSQKGS